MILPCGGHAIVCVFFTVGKVTSQFRNPRLDFSGLCVTKKNTQEHKCDEFNTTCTNNKDRLTPNGRFRKQDKLE